MKYAKTLGLALMLGMMMTGCNSAESTQSEIKMEAVWGYIAFDGEKLSVDEVEIISVTDKDKIAELGLDEKKDMPKGYYINNPTNEVRTFEVDEDTSYSFTKSNESYQTNDKQEFIDGSLYEEVPLEKQKLPFLVQAYDGQVISIMEDAYYAQ